MTENLDDANLQAIGKRLALARERAGLSQVRAAESLGTSESGLQNWESGLRPVKASVLLAACRLYRVSSDWVLGLAESQDRLPVDYWIIDADLLDEIFATTDEKKLEGMFNYVVDAIRWSAIIPKNAQVVTPAEGIALAQRLEQHLMKYAPSAYARWRSRISKG